MSAAKWVKRPIGTEVQRGIIAPNRLSIFSDVCYSARGKCMVHNLYRLYLYIVSIALLIFAAFAVGRLLNMLLTFTPLHSTDGYHPPPSSDVVQSLVFAGVSLVIAGALGGLHYWLIRRDMQNDPAAGNSAIRSFFLNMTEAIGIVLAVPVAGFLVFSILASSQSSDVVVAAAF